MSDALVVSNLSKTYPNGFTALTSVNLTVPEGTFFALLGPNGAGKSTMISIISSLIQPSQGSVRIFGVDLAKQPSKAKTFLGVVPQEFNFNQFEKVFDILVTQAGYYGITQKAAKPRAETLLKDLGLWDKKDTQARMLSGGMKRRLMIARALMHQPKLLILDEPTAGVDIELRRSMWEFMQKINAQGTTIILTTHYLEEAEQLCKRIAILDHGSIKENTDMKSLLAQLSIETFIFDLAQPLATVPKLSVANIAVKQPDEQTLEITLDKNQSLNAIFAELSQQGIQVLSMRNKANRLEELFMNLVEKNLANTPALDPNNTGNKTEATA